MIFSIVHYGINYLHSNIVAAHPSAAELQGIDILLRKYNLEHHMAATELTELTESTERGVWSGKSISVFSVAESYKKQIRFSILRLKQSCTPESYSYNISEGKKKKKGGDGGKEMK